MTRTSERVTFSIHTEHKGNLPDLVGTEFDCFAIFEGVGFWQSLPEKAARIDIIAPAQDRDKVQMVANLIRRFNRQEAVYITETKVQLTEVWTDAAFERQTA